MPIDHVVIYSGGMDSFSLLTKIQAQVRELEEGGNLYALSFRYGQRHSRELECAEKICALHGIPHIVLALPFMSLLSQSALLGRQPIPYGHYEHESMKKTVVPGRNTIMLAIAMGFAEGLDPTGEREAAVFYGAHAGDHHIYPDCRPNYLRAARQLFGQATENRVQLFAPYMARTKGRILVDGLARAPISAYADTWTCYEGGDHPCEKCGACVERAEAFAFAGHSDPLLAYKAP